MSSEIRYNFLSIDMLTLENHARKKMIGKGRSKLLIEGALFRMILHLDRKLEA